jgi:hypothetical protein
MSKFESPVNTNPQPRHEVKLPKVTAPHSVPKQNRSEHMANAFGSAPATAFPGGFFEPGEPK